MNWNHVRAAVGAAFFGLMLAAARSAAANDHIFPAAPAAKSAIDFDSHGFLIHGKRTFLVSAGMEYARVPRALWRDRLLRLKRAGFNCVEMYNFWDWHEPEEGKFDFTGDHDLNAYLKLVHSLGMYAICRVGPYYCAEWVNGGYPLWLNFKPGVKVREDDPVFEAAVDAFFDKLIPIVAANQINRGGAVVLVQLENEDPEGWGTEEPNGYFKHLQAKAVSLGLQVPYFFSGLHHGGDPGSDSAMDDPNRPNPWFTTEFWSVWFSQYGPRPDDAASYDRRTWKIIAHGGNGYNYYMAHGGSNFGDTNNNEDAASYDYGAAVGQAGDLRPLYYTFKRAAWFARSFQDVLENSVDATDTYKGAATNPAVRVTARQSPAGIIEFLDNPTGDPVQTQINRPDGAASPSAGPLTLTPGEIRPVVRDFPLPSVPGVTLTWAPTRIFGIVPQGDTTTVIVTGAAGSPAELHFTVPPSAKVTQGAASLHAPTSGTLVLNAAIPADSPAEYSFTVGPKRVRLLAVSDAPSDRTWVVDAGDQTYVVCGPDYVGDASVQNGHLNLVTEQPWQETQTFPAVAYGPGVAPLALKPAVAHGYVHSTTRTLSAWQTRNASQAASPGYDDSGWKTSAAPLPMGSDGDQTADAWYRAKLQAPAAGDYTLQFGSVRDRAAFFVDGKRVPSTATHTGSPPMTLTAGAHSLAVFTAHDGRDKLVGYLGPIDGSNIAKGLTGPALLQQGGDTGTELAGWRVLKLTGDPGQNPKLPAGDAPGWADYNVGDDPFNHQAGYAWFQTTLPSSAHGSTGSIHFESVDDNATVFVNGQDLGQHEGWDQPFDVSVGSAWHDGGPNVVTVLVQNTAGAGGLDKPATLTVFTSRTPVTGWKLRGGPGDPLAATGWAPLAAGTEFYGPQFFRATFTAAPPPAVGPHPIWRVVTTGLGHGSVWVNGHNLGRYPEKIPINGLYVPECWLTPGANSLVIYDEDGQRPDAVTIQAETAASRDVVTLTGS